MADHRRRDGEPVRDGIGGVHPPQQPVPGLRPGGQIPELPGQPERIVVTGPQYPNPIPGRFGHVAIQIVRSQPHPFAEFTEPVFLQCGSQVRPGSGIGSHRGDDRGEPGAVPVPGIGMQCPVLAALAGQQAIGESVAVIGAHQIPGADHPGHGNPQGGFPDAEIGGEPQQFGRRRPGRVRAEKDRQYDRPRGHPPDRPPGRINPSPGPVR